jgi:DNA-directed RNA polymerase specialized sigma24 family protein
VALDDALNAFAELDPRKSQVVELRLFGGLTVQEATEMLKVSPDMVMRDWSLAKVWLMREQKGPHEVDPIRATRVPVFRVHSRLPV